MATAMDEEQLPEGHWALQLQVGEEITLIPGDNEALWVTNVFLVDPESAAGPGQGVVAACVETGTEAFTLAELSSEATDVELIDPEVLGKEFCFYVERLEGDDCDDPDADAVVVQIEGFMLPLPSLSTD